MGRMSEIFELPVQAVDIEWLTMQSSDDADEAIAQAINHVDSLADALASLLEAYFSNGRVTTDDAACALKVLKSYVGDDK